jgi:ketosteroid isomerase-like protein
MSGANVALVREIYARWGRSESARELVADDLEYVNPPYAVESGVRRGRDALVKVREVYPDFLAQPERFIAAGDEVIVPTVVTGKSVSGVEISTRQTYVWTVRNGLAVRFRWFSELDEALAAAGVDAEAGEGR